MIILAIDTSCDETAVAITQGRRVLANVIYSQVLLHKKWGGVVPSIAKRAHEERIDFVTEEVLKKFSYQQNLSTNELVSRQRVGTGIFDVENKSRRKSLTQTSIRNSNFIDTLFTKIDYIAVTQGPGLAVALEVGIRKAKELAEKYNKKLIAVNHMEGHIYSCFAQNSKGNPKHDFKFPYLVLLASGGTTQLVIWKDHLRYEVIGETIDDAAGEALDKAAKMLGLGYPGGPVIERLAQEVDNKDLYKFPRPMMRSNDLNFSFSGLKTAFYYHLKKTAEEERRKNMKELVSSFQAAVFESLLIKTESAMKKTGINNLVVGGGVAVNQRLRNLIRAMVKKYNGGVVFPPLKYLNGDNAAMIGVAAYFKAKENKFVSDIAVLDRVPRFPLDAGVLDNA